MFEGLDDIDWAKLDAPSVPDLIRAITDSSRARDAWWELDDLLATRESVSTVDVPTLATAVLPFMVELARDVRVSVRTELVEGLAELWEVDSAESIADVDPDWEAAWSRQIPSLVELLEDPDIAVRRRTLLALSETTAPADVARVLAALRDHWDREPDDLTRIDMALAIGRLDGLDATDPVHAWLGFLLDQDDEEAKLGAAAVLVKVDPELPRAQEVMADAARSGDLPDWERATWLTYDDRSVADWVTGAPGRLGRRIDQCLERLGDRDDQVRIRAVRDAALMLSTWRSTEDVLLPAIAARLGDGSGGARAYAIHVIAACGAASAPFADQVAELLTDTSPANEYTDETIGDLAVWALARIGDHRCVDELSDQIRGSRSGFSVWSSGGGHPQSYMLDLPAMHQVLGPLRKHVPELLPAVRERLRSTDDYQWQREMAQTLETWGADGAAAVPELIALLQLDAAGWAARALGEMGDAAGEAAPALRRLARGPGWADRLRTSRLAEEARGRLDLPNPDRQPVFEAGNRMHAAWAYGRITGDTEFAVSILAQGLEEASARPAIRLLARLGPLTIPEPSDDRLLDRVLELVHEGDDRDRIDAALVHWRLTADPGVAVDRMVETLRPLELAFFERHMRLAVEYVAELGPLAADAAPAVRALLDLDRRLGSAGSWQSIDDDLAIRRQARTALESITGDTEQPDEAAAPQ